MNESFFPAKIESFKPCKMLPKYWGEEKHSHSPVLYFDRKQRSATKLNIKNRKFYSSSNILLNTIDYNLMGAYAHSALYAISPEGDFYAAMKSLDPDIKINHSTFLAGLPVICAGFLTVKNGIIAEVSNCSGHYKPGLEALHNTISILKSHNVSLAKVKIKYQSPGSLRPKVYDSVEEFLSTHPISANNTDMIPMVAFSSSI